jgi:hypothetical protein
MRLALNSITAAALLAASAGPAAARLDAPLNASPVAHHAKATGVQGRQFRHLGGDVVTIGSARKSAPAATVRFATPPAANGGFAWADAAIGAGLAAALLLTAAGVSAVRRQHATAARR